MSERDVAGAILARERAALDRWSGGDPSGYARDGADDLTYFDDIGAHSRVDGLEAVRRYLGTLEGRIPAHEYEIVDPRVQVFGDVGILTLHYHPFGADGEPLARWKATSVYLRVTDEWRLVHAHWSVAKKS